MKLAYTALEAGNHQICVDNNDQYENRIEFEFLSGVAANDYSNIAKKSNLKPIELNLRKLDDMSKYLVNELTSSLALSEHNFKSHDALSEKISFLSFVTIGVMIIMGFLQTVLVQKFVINKKFI